MRQGFALGHSLIFSASLIIANALELYVKGYYSAASENGVSSNFLYCITSRRRFGGDKEGVRNYVPDTFLSGLRPDTPKGTPAEGYWV